MGGTTAKLSVVDEGEPLVAYKFEAAREKRFAEGSGLPVKISVIELIEIGAGGGSIARVDQMDLLKVGPQSAGSMPGPAAYGRGGTAPTVTDANFVLGYLNPAYFAGGTMAIDMEAASRSISGIADRARLSASDVAWGVYDVVNENMASAARVHVAERGKDARDYALLPTGGGGPLHAYYLALKLGLPRIICPPAAGVASALGLLMAPARVDRAATFIAQLDTMDWKTLEAVYRRLEKDAKAVIAATGLKGGATATHRLADMRYVGQGFELVVTLPDGPYTKASREALVAAFEEEYVETFSRKPPSGTVEIVNVRISAHARATKDDVVLHGFGKGSGGLTGKRPVYFPEYKGFRSTPIYDRYQLPANVARTGPAVIEERESTLIVGPGGKFRVESKGNLIVDLPANRS
jgi:N-methylhydantoinase A